MDGNRILYAFCRKCQQAGRRAAVLSLPQPQPSADGQRHQAASDTHALSAFRGGGDGGGKGADCIVDSECEETPSMGTAGWAVGSSGAGRAADVGQGQELDPVREKALKTGASKVYIEDFHEKKIHRKK